MRAFPRYDQDSQDPKTRQMAPVQDGTKSPTKGSTEESRQRTEDQARDMVDQWG